MNYNTKEMIKLYSLCTGNEDKHDIINKLAKSWIYEEVRSGSNEAFAYEGFISNLLDIVDDLKTQSNYPKEIEMITPDVIAAVMRTRKYDEYNRLGLFEKLFKKSKKIAAL